MKHMRADLMSFDAPVSAEVWKAKHRFLNERRIEESWRRVAKAAASCEPHATRAVWRAMLVGLARAGR